MPGMFWWLWLDENGYCKKCNLIDFLLNKECVKCGDVNQGGISNCSICKKNETNNQIICMECDEDYILLKNIIIHAYIEKITN